MAKPITMTQRQWTDFHYQLMQDYPASVTLIRSAMKRVLGFTTRRNNYYDKETEIYHRLVCLDFYSEKIRTFLILKYGEFLEDEDEQ